jgi:primosomal protein N' (replication factor Y)
MRLEYQRTGRVTPLSREMVERLGECIARGEQALVLRNRRGWSAAVFCPSCGQRVSCDRCSVSLTWHRAERRLLCHHCGHAEPLPASCPHCAAETLKLVGEGSEQIEALLREALPGVSIERMDRDTIRRRGAHERLLRRFERGDVRVLVGTQMIAKGHDFPSVTLVGVVSADQALGMPDFRAAERAFQLLTQVAGRAGRGPRPGTVVIQAFDPEHPLLRQAATQDYEAFYERELRYRQALRYPPLAALVQLIVRDRAAAPAPHRSSGCAGSTASSSWSGPRAAGVWSEPSSVRSSGSRGACRDARCWWTSIRTRCSERYNPGLCRSWPRSSRRKPEGRRRSSTPFPLAAA